MNWKGRDQAAWRLGLKFTTLSTSVDMKLMIYHQETCYIVSLDPIRENLNNRDGQTPVDISFYFNHRNLYRGSLNMKDMKLMIYNQETCYRQSSNPIRENLNNREGSTPVDIILL